MLNVAWIVLELVTRCYYLEGHDHYDEGQGHIKYRVLAPTMMHIWCEYGEYRLNHSGDITLTSCFDLDGQGHDLEGQL